MIHAPSGTVYFTAVALGLLALAGHFVPDLPVITQYHFWIGVAAWAVIALDCVVRRIERVG